MSRLAHVLGAQYLKVRARDTGDWPEKERRLLASCHPKQLAFVLDPSERVAALTSGRCGKTTGGRARLIRKMMRIPNADCLFIAATTDQARNLVWDPIKDTLSDLAIEYKPDETRLVLKLLRNGSKLKIAGADNRKDIEKLRGIPRHEVGIDEAASLDAQILEWLTERIIGPRLGDYDGVLWMTGTPGHIFQGPFYDVTRPNSERSRPWSEREKPEYENWIGWSFHTWGKEDGAPYVPEIANALKNALIEKERNGWSDDHPVHKRENLGLWARDDTENVFRYRPHLDDGTAWNQWDPQRDPSTGFAILPDGHEWQYVYGMDLGFSDPFALEIFAYSLTDKTLWHVREFSQREMYARTVAQLLIGDELNAEEPGGFIGVTDWPVGMVADNAGYGDGLIAELANVYGISVEIAEKKNRHDAIELFNGDLLDGRIKILKGSELEKQLLNLQWDIDRFGKLQKNKGQRDDCADAAVYARRKAFHLFAKMAPVPKYEPGSNEALEAETIERFSQHDDENEDFDDDTGDDWY